MESGSSSRSSTELRIGTVGRPHGTEGAFVVVEPTEQLRGQAITVPRAALGTLDEGEFLVDDLIGCDAFDGARRIGRVTDVLPMPSADVLEIGRASCRER